MADEKNYLDIVVTADQAKKGIEEIANIFDSNILENNGKFLKILVDTTDLSENPDEKELLEKTSLSFEMPLTKVDDLTIIKDANGVISGAGAKVGNKVFTINGQQYIAEEGAEIFNAYSGNIATGQYSHAEGSSTKALGNYSHAEGSSTKASGSYSHAEGISTEASGNYGSHAEGESTEASGEASHAEGAQTKATQQNSHAEGRGTEATGTHAHSEGFLTKAQGWVSHAEGQSTIASNNCTHAEGYKTTASGYNSHAEGNGCTASGSESHAEGISCVASGISSHAEGYGSVASGDESHASGSYSTAASYCQTVIGRGNVIDDADTYAFIVGNGYNNESRSNALAVTWSGEIISATGKVLSSNDFTDELKTKLENMEGGSSGDGDSIIWSFGSNNGVTPIVKIGYEVLPSGRLMLHVQIGLDDIGGDSTVFTNGWSGNVSAFSTSGVNSAETNEYHNNVVKPFIKKLYDLIGHSFKISGTIGIEVSDGDNVATTFMKISIPDESTLELFIKKPDGTLTEGSLYGNITTII